MEAMVVFRVVEKAWNVLTEAMEAFRAEGKVRNVLTEVMKEFLVGAELTVRLRQQWECLLWWAKFAM